MRDETELCQSYAAHVRYFGSHMAARLAENAHKGGWEDCTFEYLFRRLTEETAELMEQVFECGTRAGVIEEAADVANFAMMIADKAMTYMQEPPDAE